MQIAQSLAQEMVLIVLILLYGTVLARLVPVKFHLYLNIGISVVAITLGLAFGLNYTEMGVSLNHILPGFFVALTATLIIIAATLFISVVPPLRHYFLGGDLAHASGKLIAFEAAIRIPFGTALVEEILFRGVLFGLFLVHYNAPTAIVASSIIFGLWHIFPTINSLEHDKVMAAKMNGLKRRKAGAVSGTVIITGAAGLIFAWLRLIAGSIIAPWLVHWSINASGVLGIAVARKLEHTKNTNKIS